MPSTLLPSESKLAFGPIQSTHSDPYRYKPILLPHFFLHRTLTLGSKATTPTTGLHFLSTSLFHFRSPESIFRLGQYYQWSGSIDDRSCSSKKSRLLNSFSLAKALEKGLWYGKLWAKEDLKRIGRGVKSPLGCVYEFEGQDSGIGSWVRIPANQLTYAIDYSSIITRQGVLLLSDYHISTMASLA